MDVGIEKYLLRVSNSFLKTEDQVETQREIDEQTTYICCYFQVGNTQEKKESGPLSIDRLLDHEYNS